jgi:hypothetical protein
MLTIAQVAKKLKVTNQAVYVAITKTKKINAIKVNNKYKVLPSEVSAYIKKKHRREYSLFKGKPLYDTEKGEVSIKQAAKMCKINFQRIYYLVRTGKIEYFKRGAAYILDKDQVMKVIKKYPSRNYSRLT